MKCRSLLRKAPLWCGQNCLVAPRGFAGWIKFWCNRFEAFRRSDIWTASILILRNLESMVPVDDVLRSSWFNTVTQYLISNQSLLGWCHVMRALIRPQPLKLGRCKNLCRELISTLLGRLVVGSFAICIENCRIGEGVPIILVGLASDGEVVVVHSNGRSCKPQS